MKRLFSFVVFFLLSCPVFAHHIIGGEMSHTFIRQTNGEYEYKITLKLYRVCGPEDENHAALDPVAVFTVIDNDNNTVQGTTRELPLIDHREITHHRVNSCITNPPSVCYEVGSYEITLTFPLNDQGYTIAFQRCCRNDLLLNADTRNFVGATYFTEIPGRERGIPGDSSPFYEEEEAIVLCSTGAMDYTFEVEDADGDELHYHFAPGFTGGAEHNLAPRPTSLPPYGRFQYRSGFSGEQPFGEEITIDSLTGRFNGRAHLTPGTYDVTIRIDSYREGRKIGSHYRDFHFEVHDCERQAVADIPPLYNECTTNTFSFTNNSTLNKPYVWDFGDGNTSTEREPTHTFDDPGTYEVWLKVDPESSCGDSMMTTVKVFPGLDADFDQEGNCILFPSEFTDQSVTPIGNNIISHHWDFGTGAVADTSNEQNPSFEYGSSGDFEVALTIETDSGCVQTVTKSLQYYESPELSVTPDLDLCYLDDIRLEAASPVNGGFQWGPNYNITDINAAMPRVAPEEDTTYKVVFTDENGCTAEDSVRITVKEEIHVAAGNDTTICEGDPVLLSGTSDGRYEYTWFNGSGEVVGGAQSVEVPTSQDETYRILAELGSCVAEDFQQTKVVPYPDPIISAAVHSICYGDSIELEASGASQYRWSPTEGLNKEVGPLVVARPEETTDYILTATDILGCPKPVQATFHLNVVPPVEAFAGNDTILITGTPYQLNATGGNRYEWTPAIGLSDSHIPNPDVSGITNTTYKLTAYVDPEGCIGEDEINIRFIDGPNIYVPTAFTPNGDGQNDVFRPIPVGITEILYFRVYNRWGELIYQTKDYMQGWDGTYKGKTANAGSYVWIVEGKDINGETITKKGAVLLIK